MATLINFEYRTPNSFATDEYDFTALPGDYRTASGLFVGINSFGYFWGSTEENTIHAWMWYMGWLNAELYSFWEDKKYGMSVRCIKD